MEKALLIIFISIGIIVGQDENLKIADDLFNKGNYLGMTNILESNLPEDSSHVLYWYKLGIAYQKMNNYELAYSALYTAYKFNKFDVDLNLALGRNYNLLGSPNYSLLFFEQAKELDPENPNVLMELANCYGEVGDYQKAIDIYEHLLEIDSLNSYYYKQAGQFSYKLGRIESAISNLERSLMLNPRNVNVALLLSSLYVKTEKLESSLSVVNTGLHYNGNSLPLLKLSAEILFKMKKYDKASIQFESVIKSGDSSSTNYQKLGFCYYLTKNSERIFEVEFDSAGFVPAINAFTKAVEKDSTDALSNIYLGICFKEIGNYTQAIKSINKGIRCSFPTYLSDAYEQLASGYELKGEYTKAIKAYKNAHNHDPQNTSLMFRLAAVYDRYYKDRNVPLLYFRRFLDSSDDLDPLLKKYANDRVSLLTEKLHFENYKYK